MTALVPRALVAKNSSAFSAEREVDTAKGGADAGRQKTIKEGRERSAPWRARKVDFCLTFSFHKTNPPSY